MMKRNKITKIFVYQIMFMLRGFREASEREKRRKEVGEQLIAQIETFEREHGFYPIRFEYVSSEFRESPPLVPGFSGVPYDYEGYAGYYVFGYMNGITRYGVDIPVCVFDLRIKVWECGPDNFGPFEEILTAYPDNYPTRQGN